MEGNPLGYLLGGAGAVPSLPMAPMGAAPTATPTAVPQPAGGGGGFDWQQLLRLAAPAALGLIAGLRGGAPAAGGVVQGYLGGMEQRRRNELDEREVKAMEEYRRSQMLSEQQQAEAAQRQAQQAQAKARLDQTRTLFNEMQSWKPEQWALVPPERRERLLAQYAQLAEGLGLPGLEVRAMLEASIPEGETLRQQAAQKAAAAFERAVKANPESASDPSWYSSWSIPTEAGPMTGQELLARLQGGQVPEYQPDLRFFTEEFTDASGATSRRTRAVDTRKVQPGDIVGRGGRAAPEKSPETVRPHIVNQPGFGVIALDPGTGKPVWSFNPFKQMGGQSVDPTRLMQNLDTLEQIINGRQ